jgi:hypothetical protein
MPWLRVEIVGFVDESNPGFVRCAFTDADGERHTFVEKIPVVTTQDLWSDSVYPQEGAVPCLSVEPVNDEVHRRTVRVTLNLLDYDSLQIPDSYVVLESQLSND